MKIGLYGYGKMGKTIEAILQERGHEVALKINSTNMQSITDVEIKSVDAIIEFTQPEVALKNVVRCLSLGIPVVSGTTGWNNELAHAYEEAKKHDTSFLHASNFSIGVNIFFLINEQLAKIMAHQAQYNVAIEEIHHTAKKDAPSGTAITLAEKVIQQLPQKNSWILGETQSNDELSIIAKRIDDVPGTHTLTYSSEIDDISLTHTAHNRQGFALGAVVAAEFISDKKGIFTMKDVLGL